MQLRNEVLELSRVGHAHVPEQSRRKSPRNSSRRRLDRRRSAHRRRRSTCRWCGLLRKAHCACGCRALLARVAAERVDPAGVGVADELARRTMSRTAFVKELGRPLYEKAPETEVGDWRLAYRVDEPEKSKASLGTMSKSTQTLQEA